MYVKPYIKLVKILSYTGAMLLAVLMQACASEARLESKYSSWIGANISELVGAWGSPQYILGGMSPFVEYGYNLSLSKKDSLPDTCIVYFRFNNLDKIIIGARHEGSRCKRAPSFVYNKRGQYPFSLTVSRLSIS